MKTRITSTMPWFSGPKSMLLLLVCFVPFVGILLESLDFPHLCTYAVEFIAPFCALFTMSLGLKYRKISYSLFNLIFVLPYSILGITIIKYLFNLQNYSLCSFIFIIYLLNIFLFDYLIISDTKTKKRSISMKTMHIITGICFNIYLFPLLLYNMDSFLKDSFLEKLFYIIILTLSVLFYFLELLRNYLYRNQIIKGKADFFLLSQISGWILLGIGLDQRISNWYIALPFSVLSTAFYSLRSFESFHGKKTRTFLVVSSFSLVVITLYETLISETSYTVMFSILLYFTFLGTAAYISFLTGMYEKIEALVYVGILFGLVYFIGALPSDFLPEIPPIRGGTSAMLSSLSTIIQSLATLFAILATFITFVFAYVLSGRIKSVKQTERGKEAISRNVDLVLLTLILVSTLSMGYRLLRIILAALTAMGLVRFSMSNENLIPNVMRNAQASFCIILMYLFLVGIILLFYYILYRIPKDRFLHIPE